MPCQQRLSHSFRMRTSKRDKRRRAPGGGTCRRPRVPATRTRRTFTPPARRISPTARPAPPLCPKSRSKGNGVVQAVTTIPLRPRSFLCGNPCGPSPMKTWHQTVEKHLERAAHVGPINRCSHDDEIGLAQEICNAVRVVLGQAAYALAPTCHTAGTGLDVHPGRGKQGYFAADGLRSVFHHPGDQPIRTGGSIENNSTYRPFHFQ